MFVKPFHHVLRSSSNDRPGHAQSPAGGVHVDYTTQSSLEMFDNLAEPEFRRGRFCIINAWRNISDSPILDFHLAMCDATTVVAPDDFVEVAEICC